MPKSLREEDRDISGQYSEKMLRNVKGSKTKNDIVERIPFTYTPVTTLEPTEGPEIQSTKMSDTQQLEILRGDEDSLVKDLFSSIMDSKEVDNILKAATKDTKVDNPDDQDTNSVEDQSINTPEEINIPEDKTVRQVPIIGSLVSTLEPKELTTLSLITKLGIMKADDAISENKSTTYASDKSINESKDKELNAQLEQDIIQILDGINLEDFIIKESKRTDTLHSLLKNKKNSNGIKDIFTLLYLSDSEQKNLTSVLSDEIESSDESGMEIVADVFKHFTKSFNKSQNILDSDKVLFDIVTDVLQEELHNKTDSNNSNKTVDNISDEIENTMPENELTKIRTREKKVFKQPKYDHKSRRRIRRKSTKRSF